MSVVWPVGTSASQQWPIYTRGNVGEVFPDVVVPLEWDIGGRSSEMGWRRGAEAIGFLHPGDYGDGDYGDSDYVLLGVFGGYAYFNASLMRLLGVRTPGLSTELVDQQFLGEVAVDPYSPRPGDRSVRSSAAMVRTALQTLTARRVPLVDDMRRATASHIAQLAPLDAPDETLLTNLVDNAAETWTYLIASHVRNTMQATIAAGALTDLCENRLGDPNIAVTLMTGIGDVVSAGPAREMWRLANETAPDRFDDELAAFLVRWGHRGPNEFSLIGRDWATYPDIARAAINTMRGLDPERSPFVQQEVMAQRRTEAVAAAKKKLGRRAGSLDRALRSTVLWSRAREESKDQLILANHGSRQRLNELMRRGVERGGVPDRLGPSLLGLEEFREYLQDPASLLATIESRRTDHAMLAALEPPFAFDSSKFADGYPPVQSWSSRHVDRLVAAAGTCLNGSPGAPGIARGPARIVTDPGDIARMHPGDVLVAPLTDPAWTPLFVSAAAVVVEVGAAMSHSMIVSRELGIPCVVGIDGATNRLEDGMEIEVDGQAGTVRVL